MPFRITFHLELLLVAFKFFIFKFERFLILDFQLAQPLKQFNWMFQVDGLVSLIIVWKHLQCSSLEHQGAYTEVNQSGCLKFSSLFSVDKIFVYSTNQHSNLFRIWNMLQKIFVRYHPRVEFLSSASEIISQSLENFKQNMKVASWLPSKRAKKP